MSYSFEEVKDAVKKAVNDFVDIMKEKLDIKRIINSVS